MNDSVTVHGPQLENLLAAVTKAGQDRQDLVTLTAWMAGHGYSASDIAYAVEKPHKYATELAEAKAEAEN